jgi:hypothetical protein
MKAAAVSPKNVQDEIIEVRQSDREQEEIGEQRLDHDGRAARPGRMPERDGGGEQAQYEEGEREVAEHEYDGVFHRCPSTLAPRPAAVGRP